MITPFFPFCIVCRIEKIWRNFFWKIDEYIFFSKIQRLEKMWFDEAAKWTKMKHWNQKWCTNLKKKHIRGWERMVKLRLVNSFLLKIVFECNVKKLNFCDHTFWFISYSHWFYYEEILSSFSKFLFKFLKLFSRNEKKFCALFFILKNTSSGSCFDIVNFYGINYAFLIAFIWQN